MYCYPVSGPEDLYGIVELSRGFAGSLHKEETLQISQSGPWINFPMGLVQTAAARLFES